MLYKRVFDDVLTNTRSFKTVDSSLWDTSVHIKVNKCTHWQRRGSDYAVDKAMDDNECIVKKHLLYNTHKIIDLRLY